jgi:hypothetical protein
MFLCIYLNSILFKIIKIIKIKIVCHINMRLYQKFIPGRKSTCKQIIKHVAEHNILGDTNYVCIPPTYDKFVTASDSPSARVSNNIRISQLVQISRGGKTQYGNFYLGQPLNVNYLGRMEGMPGGSGSPPKNF